MPAKAPVRATKVYARVVGGSRQAYCPDCGTLMYLKVPVTQQVNVITCKNCAARYYWGTVLWRVPFGVSDPPCDVYAPQFASIPPVRAKSGQAINSLKTLGPDGVTWEEV